MPQMMGFNYNLFGDFGIHSRSKIVKPVTRETTMTILYVAHVVMSIKKFTAKNSPSKNSGFVQQAASIKKIVTRPYKT